MLENIKQVSQLIDKYLIPEELEKKMNAEVSTPYQLRQEMLDKIPVEFWTSIKKVFEPCSGKGGFVIDIIDRFMEGLKDKYKDEKERYKTIVEECLYFSDINAKNIFTCKLIIDPDNKYNLNYNEGNTLELDIKEKWNIEGFDAVIGNPPYNISGKTNTGNTLWQFFTSNSLKKWLNKNGYLLFVHPPGWRKPTTERGKYAKMFDLMTKQNQMLYLQIHNMKDGMKTFNCGTRYDWYLIEKNMKYKNTIIVDENGKQNKINLSELCWLPNSNIEFINNLINKKDKCKILYDFSYCRLNNKNVSINKNNEFKYSLIYLTPKAGIRYMYSKVNDRGHFGIPKVIIGDTGIDNAINDYEGNYGMTDSSFGIIIKDKQEGENILKAITSPQFIKLLKTSLRWSNFRIEPSLFTDFNEDFWKEFI
jgi:hypothetical protein